MQSCFDYQRWWLGQAWIDVFTVAAQVFIHLAPFLCFGMVMNNVLLLLKWKLPVLKTANTVHPSQFQQQGKQTETYFLEI